MPTKTFPNDPDHGGCGSERTIKKPYELPDESPIPVELPEEAPIPVEIPVKEGSRGQLF